MPRLPTESVGMVREAIRHASYEGQANGVILPAVDALDFMRFCQRNPKPCPLLGVSETDDPIMHTLGPILIFALVFLPTTSTNQKLLRQSRHNTQGTLERQILLARWKVISRAGRQRLESKFQSALPGGQFGVGGNSMSERLVRSTSVPTALALVAP